MKFNGDLFRYLRRHHLDHYLNNIKIIISKPCSIIFTQQTPLDKIYISTDYKFIETTFQK